MNTPYSRSWVDLYQIFFATFLEMMSRIYIVQGLT